MLVIRRRAGESVLIGDRIEVEVIELASGRVKLGFHAPMDVPILRKELKLTLEQNRVASLGVSGESIARLVEHLRQRRSDEPPAGRE